MDFAEGNQLFNFCILIVFQINYNNVHFLFDNERILETRTT